METAHSLVPPNYETFAAVTNKGQGMLGPSHEALLKVCYATLFHNNDKDRHTHTHMGFETCFSFLRMSFASTCKAGQVSDHLLRWGLGRENQPAGTGECMDMQCVVWVFQQNG